MVILHDFCDTLHVTVDPNPWTIYSWLLYIDHGGRAHPGGDREQPHVRVLYETRARPCRHVAVVVEIRRAGLPANHHRSMATHMMALIPPSLFIIFVFLSVHDYCAGCISQSKLARRHHQTCTIIALDA
jgi:hypothetical protein